MQVSASHDRAIKKYDVESRLNICYKIYTLFADLIDCYVLDYFIENHWSKLNPHWQAHFENVDFTDLGEFLDNSKLTKVWPLTLLALRNVINSYALPRKCDELPKKNSLIECNERLEKLFWKNVKAKKRHEISIVSKICHQSACKTNCFYVVDIGSGVGHLSRMMCYGYDMNVCTIEAQTALTNQARYLDEEFHTMIQKKVAHNYKKIIHVNHKIPSDMNPQKFLDLVKSSFDVADENFSFGIIGLHTCGDLASTLLHFFNECDCIKFINIVGCCYMKITTHFPLSKFCQDKNYNLAYMSREIACHAIENFTDRLVKGDSSQFKIHTYRALLEKLLLNNYPEFRHCALSNVKFAEDMDFLEYCCKATKKLNLNISSEQVSTETLDLLDQWKNVVFFYTTRLIFAPVIETIILLDRLLYIMDHGNDCTIIPAFDPKTSPRNHVLCSFK